MKPLLLAFSISLITTSLFAATGDESVEVTVHDVEAATQEETTIKAGQYARESLEADESRLPGFTGKVDALITKFNFKRQVLNRYRLANQEGGDPNAMDGVKDLVFLTSISHGSEVIGGMYAILKALMMDGAWEPRFAMITGGLAIMVPGGVDFVCYIVMAPYFAPEKIKGIPTIVPKYYRLATRKARVIAVRGIMSFAQYSGFKDYLGSRYEQKNPLNLVEVRAQDYSSKNKSFAIQGEGDRFFVRRANPGLFFRSYLNDQILMELQFSQSALSEMTLSELVIYRRAMKNSTQLEMRSYLKPFGMNVKDAVLEIMSSIKDNSLEWQSERFFVEELIKEPEFLSVKFKPGGLKVYSGYRRRTFTAAPHCGAALN